MPLIDENLIILQKLSSDRWYTKKSPKDQTLHLTHPPPKLPNKQFLQILLSMRPSFPLKKAQAFPLRPLDLAKSLLKIDRFFE